MFLWNICVDVVVLIMNSLLYVEVLVRYYVEYDIYIFIYGKYGLCLSIVEIS